MGTVLVVLYSGQLNLMGSLPGSITNFLLRARMPGPKRTWLDSRLYRVHTRFHPLVFAEPAWNLNLHALATKICDGSRLDPRNREATH